MNRFPRSRRFPWCKTSTTAPTTAGALGCARFPGLITNANRVWGTQVNSYVNVCPDRHVVTGFCSTGTTSSVNGCHNYGVAAHTVARCTPISATSPYPLQQYQANNWAPGLTVGNGPSSLGLYSPPDGGTGYAGDVAACAPGRVAVGICVAGANSFDCGGDSRPPGYYAYLLCAVLQTAAPTATPTFTPTFAPTATPSFAPTQHHCTGGTHGCDVASTYCAVAFGINAYTCECLNGYIRVNATTCVATQSPTSSPTHTPTALPTATPTLTPTAAPTWQPAFEPTAAPTIAPTRHYCTGGTNVCDLTTTYCAPALPVGSNAYSCECLSGHIRVNATVCVATQTPTAAPTGSLSSAMPTTAPTATPTSNGAGQPPGNVGTNTAIDSNNSNDKWWLWCLIGFLVGVAVIGVVVAMVWARKNRRSKANKDNNQTASHLRYPLENPLYDNSGPHMAAMGQRGDTSPPLYGELVPMSPVGELRTRKSEGQNAQPNRVLKLTFEDESPSRQSSRESQL